MQKIDKNKSTITNNDEKTIFHGESLFIVFDEIPEKRLAKASESYSQN